MSSLGKILGKIFSKILGFFELFFGFSLGLLGFLFSLPGLLLGIFFDIAFPKPEAVRRLEEMDARAISAAVAHSSITGLIPKLAAFEGIHQNFFAIFRYSDPLAKQIVWEIKYRGNKKLARIVGVLLCEKILDVTATDFLIVPIPSSRRRRRWRGFNQTELIAQAVSQAISENLSSQINFSYRPDILVKIKETPAQTSLAKRAVRLSNLHGAFALKNADAANLVRGKNIILIDDVITTGATMKEAARALGADKPRGPSEPRAIFCFAIAH